MSVEAVRWVKQHSINDKLAESILIALAYRSDAKGRCGWSLKGIAMLAGLSARNVREKINWLREAKLIYTFRCSDGYAFFLLMEPGRETLARD